MRKAKMSHALVIPISPSAADYVPLLEGPPTTVTMESGYVVLKPGQSVGKHSTGRYEEALVVLAGSGEMRSADGSVLHLAAPCLAYCPPATEHDVTNTGDSMLRYVYLVAVAVRE
jgi:mannose-6-phosphate isomerase-like protein (cupin superfamily)